MSEVSPENRVLNVEVEPPEEGGTTSGKPPESGTTSGKPPTMGTRCPGPQSNPRPPKSPYGLDPRFYPYWGGMRLGWAVWVILFLLLLLIVPSLVEQIAYAYARGRERAEAEVARQLLDEGRGVTIGQYRTVVKAVQPSVVGVKASRSINDEEGDELPYHFGAGRGMREQDQGSGVIVDPEGYIITNHHVVNLATEVNVELSDGSMERAEVVGIDPATDLAVLKIGGGKLTAAPWGKSSDLEVGDPVLAIGSPFGLARTVTAGILSATGRRTVVENVYYRDFLQTDAAVNPGNSGGPLVNMQGQIVGINTAIVGPTYQGISFAIPSDMVRKVYDQLRESGKVARGWLGVSMQKDLPPETSDKRRVRGAVIMDVFANSPAAAAGIKPGDVITKWNKKDIGSSTELGLEVVWSTIGDKVPVTVQRGGKTLELSVTVAPRPERTR
jgi:serine protease Do